MAHASRSEANGPHEMSDIGSYLDLNIQLNGNGGIDKYPAKSHARRVAHTLTVIDGVILIPGTRNANWPNNDMPAPFRQDRYFYYLTGCNEPDCYVTYNARHDKLTLWLPPVNLNWRKVVYYGRGSTIEEALEKYDIDEARYIKNKKPKAGRNVQCKSKAQLIYDLSRSPEPTKTIAEMRFASRATGGTPIFHLGSEALRHAMDACRVVKDEHEINLIRKANDITAAAHVHVLKGMHKFSNEAEVEAAYMQTCIAKRAKEQAYDPIAGSGANASVLHYSANLADFGKGQTVVLDAGCEVERYASDVTRTLPINKNRPGYWPSKEAEKIYELVEKVQESCIKQMLPGNRFVETNWHAHEVTIDGLIELGILKGDPQDIFHSGTSMAFLPHGLGHHVGLDVHDVSPVPHPPVQGDSSHTEAGSLHEAYVKWKKLTPTVAQRVDCSSIPGNSTMSIWSHARADRFDAPALEPNMIVTVEPGIYFNDFLLKQFLENPKTSRFIDAEVLKRYIPVGGVRIEDDILITRDGYENLTTAPKGEEMLKIIRDSAKHE